ncbi:mitochondrial ribosomal protein L22 [Musca autumnalis]|uniref:mitochondrial ribosomal protein L22 n=1 Tax=Musca autumnalis TaxID=221902 RepID=UPI003CE6FF0E
MNNLAKQLCRLNISHGNLLKSSSSTLSRIGSPAVATAGFHTSNALQARYNKHNTGPQKWLQYNKVVHPPQAPEEEPRKAYVCHMRTNIKYSPDKMWYIASFVRGMSVDEALKQLNFVLKKGAVDVKEVIQEAVEMAQKRHNVEYKSNLWIAESFVGKGRVIKGFRRHGRGRFGLVEYKHCHYFVRLEEGEPPKNYYLPNPQTPSEQFEKWLEQMRMRKVINSL